MSHYRAAEPTRFGNGLRHPIEYPYPTNPAVLAAHGARSNVPISSFNDFLSHLEKEK